MPKVTLVKPGTGSTQWGTNVGQNWTDVEDTFKGSLRRCKTASNSARKESGVGRGAC